MTDQDVSKGLAGVIAADTHLSRVDGEQGKLIYRGYRIRDLGANASFEEVVYLLWYGDLPTLSELEAFEQELAARRELPAAIVEAMQTYPREAHPMAVLRTVVSHLGLLDPDADASDEESARDKAMRLTAVLPTIVAAWERIRNGQQPLNPREELGHAANFLYMLDGQEATPEAVDALDTYLVLLADHGFNASTFAARVTTGTLADFYSAVTTALGTLKGAAHGGANQAAMEQFMEADELGVSTWYRQSREEGRRIMGIGHRVYKTEDPRANILRPLAQKLAENSGQGQWFQVARQIEELTRQDDFFVERNLYANVDYYSAVVLKMINLPIDQFTCAFAMSRIAGWSAHIQEQMADNRLIRPKARYVGPEDLTFTPIGER
jgi:citrate synthase